MTTVAGTTLAVSSAVERLLGLFHSADQLSYGDTVHLATTVCNNAFDRFK